MQRSGGARALLPPGAPDGATAGAQGAVSIRKVLPAPWRHQEKWKETRISHHNDILSQIASRAVSCIQMSPIGTFPVSHLSTISLFDAPANGNI